MPNAAKSGGGDPRVFLRGLFDAAIAAAAPGEVLARFLPPPPKGRTIVVGAGKAAASMAAALEAAWPGPLEGLVVTRYGHRAPTRAIEVVEAAHPTPDAAGAAAAARILERVKGLSADDLVLCLISGGGSALLALPAPGLSLADKQTINRALLKSGAGIAEINCVRKHLSAIKGGRLAAAAAPARVVALIISDVPGDDPATIASGPTTPDPTTSADALAILRRYAIDAPAHVLAHLESAAAETPKPGDARFAQVANVVVAAPRLSLAAAAAAARSAGVTPLDLGDAIEGEAREVGKAFAGIALSAARRGAPARGPCVLISGGETTVTVRGKGRGGRNSEFLLGLAIGLDGAPGIWALAGDTDGIDGSEDNAGAIVAPDTLARTVALGLAPRARLDDNDAYSVFAALGDLVVTGPTLTNVNDFRAILIEQREGP
ncbi:MAG: glycerate kinase [Roseiarcus sp.]|jgi:hydroxypyruvate reductase